MTVGERIRDARKKAGLTQSELGDRMGIPYQGISQWENSRRDPKYGSIKKIADALQIPIETLLSDQTKDAYEIDSLKLEEARMEREAQFNKDMDDLRKIQKERDKLMLEADKTVLDAIQCAAEMMKILQEEEEEKGVVAMDAADLVRAIAAMRESLNQKHYPISYCGVA